MGGLLTGSVVGALIYLGIVSIPTKYIFRVTTWLLALLSAGMASVGAKYLVAAGYFSNLSDTLFNISWFIPEQSVIGQILHAMFGYSEQPMTIQVLFYAATITIFVGFITLIKRQQMRRIAV